MGKTAKMLREGGLDNWIGLGISVVAGISITSEMDREIRMVLVKFVLNIGDK